MSATTPPLELQIAPDDIVALSRLSALAGAARGRGQAMRLVLHDAAPMPDHDLEAGRAAEIACFEAQERIFTLADGSTLTSRDGMLRGVSWEQRQARLLLQGAPDSIATLLHELATLRVGVPRGSLAEHATTLARGREDAPRAGVPPRVATDQTPHTAFIGLGQDLLRTGLRWADRIPHTTDPEAVHQMRVTIRRWRSLLVVFRKLIGDAAATQWVPALREANHRLGAVRDWDVFLHDLGATLRQAWPADRRVTSLLAAAARRRLALRAELQAYLDGPAFRRLQLEFAGFLHLRPWADADPDLGDLPDFAARALSRLRKQVLAPGDALPSLPIDDQHRIRRRAKRLRYAAEFFRPIFPGQGAKGYIARVNAVQDAIGWSNDARNVAALMAQLGPAGAGFAAGLALGYAERVAVAAHPDVAACWDKLRDAEPFWR